MSEKMQETIADIRREADRLEAAHKSEVDKLNSAIQATVSRSDAEIDRLRREVEELKKTNGELATLIDLEKIPPIELSKNASKNGAAVSREAATAEKSSAVGNCAKLREAMKRIVAASIVAKNANAPEWILQRMADIFAVATTALAAPPRNCDKYANYNDAMKAFEVFVIEQGKLGLINPYPGVLRWLFAPATEKEGGAK